MTSHCTSGKTPPKGDFHSQQKSKTSLTCASPAGLQWVRGFDKRLIDGSKNIKIIKIISALLSATSMVLKNKVKFSLYFSLGSGKVPDQLVKLKVKHGVEAKDRKEVS